MSAQPLPSTGGRFNHVGLYVDSKKMKPSRPKYILYNSGFGVKRYEIKYNRPVPAERILVGLLSERRSALSALERYAFSNHATICSDDELNSLIQMQKERVEAIDVLIKMYQSCGITMQYTEYYR